MVATTAIGVNDLHKRYGEFEAVGGVSFEVAKGEVFALLGPNGAGKTTTLEILEGYRERTSGAVSVLGFDPVATRGRSAGTSASCCRAPPSSPTSRSARS